MAAPQKNNWRSICLFRLETVEGEVETVEIAMLHRLARGSEEPEFHAALELAAEAEAECWTACLSSRKDIYLM